MRISAPMPVCLSEPFWLYSCELVRASGKSSMDKSIGKASESSSSNLIHVWAHLHSRSECVATRFRKFEAVR